MEAPIGGSNNTQSFFDFDTSIGKFRFGIENGKIFFQKNLNQSYSPDVAKRYMDGKMTDQLFSGEIRLDNDLTHYSDYTVSSSIAVTLASNPIIGGSAEIRMIGDGTHSPSFGTAFTKSGSSGDFVTTLAAVNKVVFYYDGTNAFYSITNL